MPVLAYLNRCGWTPVAGGTGDFVFDTAKAGFYAPADCQNPPVFDGFDYAYFAESADRTVHEEGQGAFDVATGTLARTKIRNSSDGGSKVTFSSPPTVYMGSPDALNVAMALQQADITFTPTTPNPTPYKAIQAVGFFDARNGMFFTAPFGPWMDSYQPDPNTFPDLGADITAFENNVVGVSSNGISVNNFPFLATVSFPELQILDDTLSIQGTSITTISIPKLRYLSQGISVDFSQVPLLTSFALPSLVSTDSIQLQNDPAGTVTSVDLSSLQYSGTQFDNGLLFDVLNGITDLSLPVYISGGLIVTNCAALTSFEAPAYVTGGVDLENNPLLATIDLSSYQTQGFHNFFIGNDPLLTEVLLPAFTTGDVVDGNQFEIFDCAALATIDLSALVATPSLSLSNLSSLTSLDLSALTTITAFSSGIDFETLEALTGTLDFSGLVTDVSGIGFSDVAVSAIDLSALVTSAGFNFDTMPNLTALDLPAMTTCSAFLVQTAPVLATFSAAACTDLGADNAVTVSFQGCDVLTSIDLSAVTTFTGGLTIESCPLLTALDFPAMTAWVVDSSLAATWTIDSCDVLASITADNMTDFGGAPFGLALLNLLGGGLPLLTSISFPACVNFGGMTWDDTTTALTSVTLAAALDIGQISVTNAGVGTLTSFSIPLVQRIWSDFIIGGAALTTFSFPSSLLQVLGNVVVLGTLDQTSVDSVLVSLAGLDGSGSTGTYDNHTVDLTGSNASPGVTGLAAKVVLEGRGNTVNVN